MGRDSQEMVDSAQDSLIFHTYAHPHILGPRQMFGEGRQPFAALRKYLENVPRRLLHDRKDALDEVEGDGWVEEITH
jgi:hypothetical protein